MRLQLARAVGVLLEVRPVGVAVAEQHVHDGAGQRPVGARPHAQRQVGLLHGAVVVDVDGHDLGAALLARAGGVRHHVDLRVDGVGAPDHHHVGLRHLARVGAGQPAGAGDVAGPRQRGADGGVHARVALGVAQPVDAVAHHQAHGAGVVVGPHGLGAVAPLGGEHGLGGEVEGVVPGDALELARALGPLAPQRVHEPVGMVHALGVARDLGADDAGRVAVVLGAVHPADPAVGQQLDVERARGRAVVRADRMTDLDLGVDVHGEVPATGDLTHATRVRCAAGGGQTAEWGQTPCTPQYCHEHRGKGV